MKKLYQEFFQIPQDGEGKIRDKVFLSRIALSVMIMLTCMVVMSLSAYAFFTSSITSQKNTITSANYDLVIKSEDGLTAAAENPYVFELSGKVDSYKFTLSVTENTTATVGYCKIVVNGDIDNPYYTHPIWKESGSETPERLIKCIVEITVPVERTVTVQFIPQWGSYSGTAATNPIDLSLMFPTIAGDDDEVAKQPTDGGNPDEGNPDKGTPDEGTPDEGTTDEGTPGEGTPDEGTPDEGTTDEGATDEGNPDSSPEEPAEESAE